MFYSSKKDSAKNIPNLRNTSLNLIAYTKNNLSGKKIAVISNGLQSLQLLKGQQLDKIRYQRKGNSKMVSIKTTQQGLQDGWTRATFILKKHHLEEIKALAYWERKTIKEVIDEALGSYLKGKKCSNSEAFEELKHKPSKIGQEFLNNF